MRNLLPLFILMSAGLAAGAIGTDTGGSVRIPSAFCGLTGLKTTQGRVSNFGVDQAGDLQKVLLAMQSPRIHLIGIRLHNRHDETIGLLILLINDSGTLADLEKLQRRIYEQLGVRVAVAPGFNEVRSMRGIAIQIDELPGLCRKTRQAIPTAIRRGLEKHPQIAYDLLNTHDLLRDA